MMPTDQALIRSEATHMEYLWLFLLFFAALAAGWFYLQRAKARSTTTSTDAEATPPADAVADASDERPAS
jgi:hypothetical protein